MLMFKQICLVKSSNKLLNYSMFVPTLIKIKWKTHEFGVIVDLYVCQLVAFDKFETDKFNGSTPYLFGKLPDLTTKPQFKKFFMFLINCGFYYLHITSVDINEPVSRWTKSGWSFKTIGNNKH